MKNESQFKVAFKQSVRKAKGYSISLAAPVFPGIPDLYVILTNYMPVLIEAKWLGTITNRKFKRKIQYSPMQLNYAKHLNSVQPSAMLGLIGLIYKDEICCVLDTINSGAGGNILTNEKLTFESNYVTRQGGCFDVEQLFRRSSIPRLEENAADVMGIARAIRDIEGPLISNVQPIRTMAIPGQDTKGSTN